MINAPIQPLRQRRWPFGSIALLAVIPLACFGMPLTRLESALKSDEKGKPAPDASAIEVVGRTQCVPRRKAIIAPAAPPHPVTEVLVALGDRVKKGQPLVKLDDDEPRADLRLKQATLEGAEEVLKEARCRLEASEKLHDKGAVAQEHYHEIRTAAIKAEKDAQVAKAAVEGAKAELEHYVLQAAMNGIVNRLDVYQGTVSRPGTTVWGEILDLSEIDVHCELSPEHVDQLAVGQSAEVRANGNKSLMGKAQVVFIGLSANKTTGLVQVVVRLPNPQGRLRCEAPVQVRFALPGR